MSVVVCLVGLAVRADIARSNEQFTVAWDGRDGTLASVVMNGDPHRMNWIAGTDRWGALRRFVMGMERKGHLDICDDTTRFDFTGMRTEGESVVSTYACGEIRATVRRTVTAEALEEAYEFTNTATWPVYFLRGHLGILATFNDSYAAASVSETQRCHAHIWCGGENSWVRALKMGPFPTELALVLQKGDLDAYSVRRIQDEISNDRGDFVLHPGPFHLNPGASKTIAWKLVAHPAGRFDETLLRNGGVRIAFRQETIFPDEEFVIDVTGPDGRTVRETRRPDRGVGEYGFEFDVGGRKCRARGYCSPAFDDLVTARVRYIVGRQQCLERDSPLYGAYLIWDSEDDAPYFDQRWHDHNACRERVIMAETVARWLRRHPEPEVMKSLELFERFVLREFFDEKTCTVYDTIGKNPKFKRLYNAPNLVQFWRELYALKGEARYLDYIERSLLDYYRLGGGKFYPNGCDFSSELVLLERAGRKVPRLREAVCRHVATATDKGRARGALRADDRDAGREHSGPVLPAGREVAEGPRRAGGESRRPQPVPGQPAGPQAGRDRHPPLGRVLVRQAPPLRGHPAPAQLDHCSRLPAVRRRHGRRPAGGPGRALSAQLPLHVPPRRFGDLRLSAAPDGHHAEPGRDDAFGDAAGRIRGFVRQ